MSIKERMTVHHLTTTCTCISGHDDSRDCLMRRKKGGQGRLCSESFENNKEQPLIRAGSLPNIKTSDISLTVRGYHGYFNSILLPTTYYKGFPIMSEAIRNLAVP